MSTDARMPAWLGRAAAVALILAFAALGWRFWSFAAEAIPALQFIDELDYGEGIVWHQAMDLFTPRAYGPIDGFPTIVYHYTPFFHAMTRLVAALGIDMLIAGRLVSLGATIAIAISAGMIAARAADPGTSRQVRLMISGIAALAVFCCWPLILWAPMMRVDMLAIAMGFLGILAGIAALRRPWLIHVAALAFVASVYTKQTEIAAPGALFLLLLAVRPRLALHGIATTILAGLVVLAALVWATDGGFVRHVFLYNINRLELWRLWWMWDMIKVHLLFFVVALRMAWPRLRAIRARLKQTNRADMAEADIAYLVAGLYFVFSWAMALTVAKSGSNVNYFIEWLCALAIFVGLGLGSAARSALGEKVEGRSAADMVLTTIVMPLLVAMQAVMLDPPSLGGMSNPARLPALERLASQVRAADKPIISDNMVLLLRSGKPVVWEPAIFAELAHKGVWNEQPFVARIRRGEFAFFVSVGNRGQRLYDSRYNPAVADAIATAYPVTEVIAGYTIHRPAAAALPAPSPQQPQP